MKKQKDASKRMIAAKKNKYETKSLKNVHTEKKTGPKNVTIQLRMEKTRRSK